MGSDQGVFGISVTAGHGGHRGTEPSAVRAQRSARTVAFAGGTRLYSADDIDRLNRITDLLADGLNLAGIAMVLDLEDDNTRLRNEISNSLHRDENTAAAPKTTASRAQTVRGAPTAAEVHYAARTRLVPTG